MIILGYKLILPLILFKELSLSEIKFFELFFPIFWQGAIEFYPLVHLIEGFKEILASLTFKPVLASFAKLHSNWLSWSESHLFPQT